MKKILGSLVMVMLAAGLAMAEDENVSLSPNCKTDRACTSCHSSLKIGSTKVKEAKAEPPKAKPVKKAKKTKKVVASTANPPTVTDPKLVELNAELVNLAAMLKEIKANQAAMAASAKSSTSTTATTATVTSTTATATTAAVTTASAEKFNTCPEGKLDCSDGNTWVWHNDYVMTRDGKVTFDPNRQYIACGEKDGLYCNQWFAFGAETKHLYQVQPPAPGSKFWTFKVPDNMKTGGKVRFNIVQLSPTGEPESWVAIHKLRHAIDYVDESTWYRTKNGDQLMTSKP